MNAKALKIIAATTSLIAIPTFASDLASPQAPAHPLESFSELDRNSDEALDRSELDPIGIYGLTIDEILTRYDVDDSQSISEPEYRGMQDYLAVKQRSYSDAESGNAGTSIDETLATKAGEGQEGSDLNLDIDVQAGTVAPDNGSNKPMTGKDNAVAARTKGMSSDTPATEMVAPELPSQAETNNDRVAELEWSEDTAQQDVAADSLRQTTPQATATSDITVAENIYSADVTEIIGTEVQNDEGQRIGEVESILIDKKAAQAGVVITTDQAVTLFTPVKYLRLEDDALVVIEGVTPNASYDKSRYREIEPSADSINSALRRLELSHTY